MVRRKEGREGGRGRKGRGEGRRGEGRGGKKKKQKSLWAGETAWSLVHMYVLDPAFDPNATKKIF
jgi:hypothetical protein